MQLEALHDPNSGSLPARVTGMASRFVARRFRRKPLLLRNASPLVTFTFDDVPASACEIGAPILEDHGARGTFYVAGGHCGTAGPNGTPRASIDQLRTVWQNGHEIGCHTFSHVTVRHLKPDELARELKRNQAVLKKIDDTIAARNFAYPYGDLSVRSKRYLESRFDSCRSGHAGVNADVADLGALHACPLQNSSLDRIKIADLIAQTVAACGWLIFCSHDVADHTGRYGVSPTLLEWTVGAVKKSGCALATVAEGLRLAGGANLRPPSLSREQAS